MSERELVPFFFENVLRDAVRRINREVFNRIHGDSEVRVLQYLKYGADVYLRKRQRKVAVKLIDYENPENNLFFYLVRPTSGRY